MERAYYDSRPSVFEAVGNGNHLYRWDIQEESVSSGLEVDTDTVQYSCLEATIVGVPTYDKCVKAVIRKEYTAEQELALVNKYNSYRNGVYAGDDAIEEYNAYLKHVFDVKMAVKMDLEMEESLAIAKEKLLSEIATYDTSSAVNSFTLDGETLWLDKATRVGLMNSTNIERAEGRETTTLWFGGKSYTLPCDTAIRMLSALELYALECYNVTAQHKADVQALQTKEEVEAYDYTVGYPAKLDLKTK